MGPQTIEEMKALAVDMFSDIENRGVAAIEMDEIER